jgi:hypothetical protein
MHDRYVAEGVREHESQLSGSAVERDDRHIENTLSQDNPPAIDTKLRFAANRVGRAEHLVDLSARRMLESDLNLPGHLDEKTRMLGSHLAHSARVDDPHALQRLRTIPGVGKARPSLGN